MGIRVLGVLVAVALVCVVVVIGCGGSDDPSPQEAETYVGEKWEADVDKVDVRDVYCEEGSGGRYECSITYTFRGIGGDVVDRVLIDFDEIE